MTPERRPVTAAEPCGTPAIELASVTKSYHTGAREVAALRGVSIQIPAGAFLAVMGPSGCGKSTFLACASGLDVPTSGAVRLAGRDIAGMSETARTKTRRALAGYIFQSYNLLPALTVSDNILLPLRLTATKPDHAWLATLVATLGLRDALQARPAELSGGQQQRVAIARALAPGARIVFADEPTGALDLHTSTQILDLLTEVVDHLGCTVVMVTHDPVAAARAHDTLVMADGRFVEVLAKPDPALLASRLVDLGRQS